MPIEFIQESQPTGSSDNSLFRLTMAYDGSGRRISKTRWVKKLGSQEWEKELVTHYTGIGTEVREDLSKNQTKVVVNMPEGFGRYGVEDASKMESAGSAGEIPMMNFEWYLKNHLGSTMLVYGTQGDVTHYKADFSKPKAAYDYRAFGEQVNLVSSNNGVDKVTENFTGKEFDDEIALSYFGARYLDPMLGLWTSVDPKRQFASPYLYAGNGYNPVNAFDPDGNVAIVQKNGNNINVVVPVIFSGEAASEKNILRVQQQVASQFSGKFGKYTVSVSVVSLQKDVNGGDMSGINQVELRNSPYPGCERGSCVRTSASNYNYQKFFDAYGYWDRHQAKAWIDVSGGEDGDYRIRHEFGHLLGIDDQYGYEDNLMGVHGATGLDPSQIEEMWIPNSKQGSEGNFIDEK